MNSNLNTFSPLTDRPTPAPSPNPHHCWGKPPSLVLGSAVTGQSPAVAPPVLAGSSSPLRRSAASICWQSAPRQWTGCRRIETSRPAKSRNPSAQDINKLTWLVLSSRLYLAREREPSLCVWELLEQLDQSCCLFDTRDCFKRENISFCCCKAFNLWSMPCFKLLGRKKKQPNTTQSYTACLQMKYLIASLGSSKHAKSLKLRADPVISAFSVASLILVSVININKSMRKADLLANANILSSTQHTLSCSIITCDATVMKS